MKLPLSLRQDLIMNTALCSTMLPGLVRFSKNRSHIAACVILRISQISSALK